MKIRKLLHIGYAVGILLLFPIGMGAQNIERYEQLQSGEIVIEVHSNRKDLSLLFDSVFRSRIESILQDVDPNIVVETMALLPYSIDEKSHALNVYNTFRTVSELTQARYFSETKGDTHPVFHESYRVKSPEDLSPLSDPLVQDIPFSDTIYIHQNPSSLIEVTSRVEYLYRENQILMVIDNLTDIRFHFMKFIRLVKPHNLKTIALAVPYEGKTVLYLLGCADAFRVLGIGAGKSEELIYNRTQGMMQYYTEQLRQHD